MNTDPDLRQKMADLIDQHVKGSANVSDMTNMGPMGNVPGPMSGGAAPNPMMNPAPPAMPAMMGQQPAMANQPQQGGPEYDARLDALEQAIAEGRFDKELAEAKAAYEAVNQHFGGLLPPLDETAEKAIAKLALDNNGLSMKEAAKLWAMQQAMSGEGTFADRVMAKKMENPKTAGLPKVEGPGGGIPSGAQQPPQNLKDANRMAKEVLRAAWNRPGT